MQVWRVKSPGDDESARASDNDGQEDEPRVASVRHHRQTDDLEYETDDGQTEVAHVEEVDETGKQNGRGETETGVVGRQQISVHSTHY